MKKNYLLYAVVCVLVLGLGIFALTRKQDSGAPAGSETETTEEKTEGSSSSAAGKEEGSEAENASSEASSSDEKKETEEEGGTTAQPTPNPDTELPEIEIPLNEDDGEIPETPAEQQSSEEATWEDSDEVTVDEDGSIYLPMIP